MYFKSENIINNIEDYLIEHQNKELVKFITCGSVDDGKSTLIGRLLFDTKMIYEDQLSSIQKDSKKYGTTNEEIDLALLVDGLQSEREQGITIDVAYRYFSTNKRKYIIADTPGHEQYTRNMVTGSSNSDIAILLIDAEQGVLTQTKRHSFIVSLLGISEIIVAINKIDLVAYSHDKFSSIVEDVKNIIHQLPNSNKLNFHFIPISALKGDNVVEKSLNMEWYKGSTLLDLLDELKITKINEERLIFPVQYVNRPNRNFRGFTGNLVGGRVKVGDKIKVLPSMKTSSVKEIINNSELVLKNEVEFEVNNYDTVKVDSSITLTLNDEIDISRGDLIVHENENFNINDKFTAYIVWFNENPSFLNSSYIIKRGVTSVYGKISEIRYKKDINNLTDINADKLHLNDIAKCVIELDRKIPFESYSKNKELGSFIIIDSYTNETVAAGMILSNYQQELNSSEIKLREYNNAEKELNAYIRKFYPEWGCKEI